MNRIIFPAIATLAMFFIFSITVVQAAHPVDWPSNPSGNATPGDQTSDQQTTDPHCPFKTIAPAPAAIQTDTSAKQAAAQYYDAKTRNDIAGMRTALRTFERKGRDQSRRISSLQQEERIQGKQISSLQASSSQTTSEVAVQGQQIQSVRKRVSKLEDNVNDLNGDSNANGVTLAELAKLQNCKIDDNGHLVPLNNSAQDSPLHQILTWATSNWLWILIVAVVAIIVIGAIVLFKRRDSYDMDDTHRGPV